MPALRELQLRFAEAVLSGQVDGIADRLRVRNGTPAERLAVYRNNTLSNLRGALREVYPIVEQLVGEVFFKHAAGEFIAVHPSTSGDLNDYGDGFAGFLATYPPATTLPYLPDVARLEWALERAYYAADSGNLELSRLGDVPPERYGDLRLLLHPAATLVQSDYPLLAIWEMHQPDYAGDGELDLGAGDAALLVTRRGLQTLIEPLDRAEYIFLALLGEGRPFDLAVTAALERDENFPLQVRLQHRIALGDIVGFTLDPL